MMACTPCFSDDHTLCIYIYVHLASGSNRGNNSTSSSDDDSEVEGFFRADSAYDCSDAEESVIMLPHLRQKHLEASLSANAVNADVGSICSQASQPITLRYVTNCSFHCFHNIL